jgi:hypothetical protein
MKTINVRIEFDETKQNNVVDIIRELGICESATELPPQGDELIDLIDRECSLCKSCKTLPDRIQNLITEWRKQKQPAAPVAPARIMECPKHSTCKRTDDGIGEHCTLHAETDACKTGADGCPPCVPVAPAVKKNHTEIWEEVWKKTWENLRRKYEND